MSWTNYHSHCHYCDGTHNLEDYLVEAIKQQVKAYGFSSHAPLPFATSWAMSFEQTFTYFREVQQLKKKYQQSLQVYLGFEQDYIANTRLSRAWFKTFDIDYTIGSVHFVDAFANGRYWEIDNTTKAFKEGLKTIFDDDIQKALKRYYALIREMIQVQHPQVIGHLDKIKIHNRNEAFFDEREDWYRAEVLKTLKAAAKAGCVIEVNTRGVYKKKAKETYPSHWILEHIHELGIPIMLNSDTHHPADITKEFANTARVLRKIGFKKLTVLFDCQWQQRFFDEDGIDLD